MDQTILSSFKMYGANTPFPSNGEMLNYRDKVFSQLYRAS